MVNGTKPWQKTKRCPNADGLVGDKRGELDKTKVKN